MSHINKTHIKYILGSSWGILGFVRGINSFDYSNSKVKSLENEVYIAKYTEKFVYGLSGIFVYVNPILFPIMIYKELYRLEVNIRGLEPRKCERFYNDIL